MEIIYRSFDGVNFATEEDCLAHERERDYKMWDSNGITHFANDAEVVFLTPNNVKGFIEWLRREDICSEGLESDISGTYIWDSKSFQWVHLSELTTKALLNYLKDMGEV